MKIQTNGVAIHLRDAGDGAMALVFLHYWGGSSRTWRHVTDTLSPRYRTIATDHRGWGESDPGDGNYSIAQLAADAEDVIRTLGLKRYVLVGHSMGGKVAQLMASRQPKGLEGLVLVAPATPTPSPVPLDQRQFMTHAYDSRETVLATCTQVLTAKTLDTDDLAQVVEDSLKGSPEAKRFWPLHAMIEDISSTTKNIRVPTLIVAGERDKVDPVDGLKADVLPHITGATLQVLPGTGHLSPLESPAQLSEVISSFVDRLH